MNGKIRKVLQTIWDAKVAIVVIAIAIITTLILAYYLKSYLSDTGICNVDAGVCYDV